MIKQLEYIALINDGKQPIPFIYHQIISKSKFSLPLGVIKNVKTHFFLTLVFHNST